MVEYFAEQMEGFCRQRAGCKLWKPLCQASSFSDACGKTHYQVDTFAQSLTNKP